MGRKKKTLHDYAAEFSELAVKRHLLERGAAGEAAAVVETLYCTPCQLPMRVRRDRILEHLSSGRHYRNRRLLRQHGLRAPLLLSAGPDIGTSLPLQLDAPSLLIQPSFILAASAGTSTSYGMDPSPPSYHKPLVPQHPITASSPASVATPREDPTPSTSARHPSALATSHMRIVPTPSTAEASNGAMPTLGHGSDSNSVGLALFGIGLINKGLFQSLMEENGCCLLYVVADQLEEVERAFGAEFLAVTMVLRQQDADVALNDQRVSGAIICSPPEEASKIVIDALRAGKGVFCESLPSFDRQTAEACFDEADRCGRPLVCGFYKRFDPALQFLYQKVRDSQALGRIHRISTISSIYPAASPSFLKASGGIFYNAAVHDIDIISLLLGESALDTIFSLGHAFCADMACLKDADTVAVSMKFPSGAIVTLDISQHCTRSCDHRLEVHGSRGTLRVDNQNPLGITEHGTSVSIYSQTQADRYRDAHRELFRHFLRTLKGKEPPAITKEQFLWTIQVAAAAEQSWRNGSAVDLRNKAIDSCVIKTEIV
ncbi:myo-inositol 2-dehydrogenase-like [Falco rusticolus]|uniref:myo-inositol 2-dehydrogenase-like n=1 Tax=Falco rusticolus TaxID=120794 RepID=UPI001886A91C|nr:myo-inositol 2-dehydrogenase-like [Falco rusticolus]XP_055560768.1 myo-inositol 2-dehydrogenase-like [Falco cherrug]